MEIQKSYFAIIPANVRYDKDICANAKLLYGEITALCNEKGYCWASNEYFANLYDTHKRTISRWISELTNKGYLNIKIIKKENGEVDKRILSIAPPKFEEHTAETCSPKNDCDNVIKMPTKNEFEELIDKWADYKRQKGNGFTAQQREQFKKKLSTLSMNDVSVAKEIVEKAISSNWNNVFELNQTDKKSMLKKEYEKNRQIEFENRQIEFQKQAQRQTEMKNAICDKQSAIAYLKEFYPKNMVQKSLMFKTLAEDFNITIKDVVGE